MGDVRRRRRDTSVEDPINTGITEIVDIEPTEEEHASCRDAPRLVIA